MPADDKRSAFAQGSMEFGMLVQDRRDERRTRMAAAADERDAGTPTKASVLMPLGTASPTSPSLPAIRLGDAPIVIPTMLPAGDGGNVNGPSLIRAPDWLPGRLATYYLYFAHHNGTYIRLALADRLGGPWQIYERGTLRLEDTAGAQGHIASPDVHVDEARRQIVMFFHGPVRGRRRQLTFIARSDDGLRFRADRAPVGDFYMRVVPWRGTWVGMSKGGAMYRAALLDGPYRRRWLPPFPMSGPDANGRGDVRHVALRVDGDQLTVYFSRIGDAPEHTGR